MACLLLNIFSLSREFILLITDSSGWVMSKIRQIIIGSIGLICCSLSEVIPANASGKVSGFVRDKETGLPLPGAAVIVQNTTFGATADKQGVYTINNLPAGTYNLRATMIGYIPVKVTEVEIKTGLNTPVPFDLTAHTLLVEKEIIITAPRIKIYRDELSSIHFVGAQDLAVTLPAQTFQEALPLVPGFVANHFRGSRTANTLYLIDGLPASGPLTRDLAFSVPSVAIAEMVVQTGGFGPEYGNVSGGLVNLITKEGRNAFNGTAKIATDAAGRQENGFENTRRAEFAVAGPLTLGFGGPVVETNYLISGGFNLSDTPDHAAMRQAFKSPVFSNYEVNAKISIHASPKLDLRLQALVSDYDWRLYNAAWNTRLSALPKRQNHHVRLSASLTHTLNAATFYKLDLAGLKLRRQVLGDAANGTPANLDLPSPSVASFWPGATEPWNEHSVEKQLTAQFSLVRQLHPAHQLKLGVEANYWDLSLQRRRYLLLPGAATDANFVYSRYADSFRQFPFTFAGYVNHKIEQRSLILNLGLRYELFSPQARQSALPAVDSSGAVTHDFLGGKNRFKRTFSPRLSLAIPLGEIEHFSFNYGWFYELPQLYYLYLNRAGDSEAYWPILGNVDLKPSLSRAWEVTYRRVVSPQTVYALTYFYRQQENLLDTFPYLISTGVKAQSKVVMRFENRAAAEMSGVELSLKRDFGKGVNGALAYTYLRTQGTASWPESRLLRYARGEYERRSPLAWDQRHTLTINLGYLDRRGYLLNVFGKFNGAAASTEWLTGFENKLQARRVFDVKAAAPLRLGGWRLEPFVEVHNIFNEPYVAPGEGGLDLSQPLSAWRNQFGRQIWVGVTYR